MEHPSFALPHRAVYESPRVESFEIAVEQGFALSDNYDDYDDNDGTEKPGRDDIGDNWYFG